MTKAMQNIDEEIEKTVAMGTWVYRELYNNFTTNPKKLTKFLFKMYSNKNIPEEYRKGIIRDAYEAKDPVKYLRDKLMQLKDMPNVIEQLIEQGFHGLIKIKDTIIPVQLNTHEKWLNEGQRWHPEQETMIAHDLATNWMKENKASAFDGEVILFAKYGFTGYATPIVMRTTTNTEHLVRVAGTDYYVKKPE